MSAGRLYGLGVGPGDPELITLKAHRLLQAADVVAYPTGRSDDSGNALSVVTSYIRESQICLPLRYPATAGPVADSTAYPELMQKFYDQTANDIADHLQAGRDVALICLGDPFFYGSYMYWHARLAERFETIVVPGVSSVMAGPAALGMPLCHRNDCVTVIPATLDESAIEDRLRVANAAVIMKLGRTLPKVRRVLQRLDMLERAYMVERATMDGEKIIPMSDTSVEKASYFSIVVVPCATPY